MMEFKTATTHKLYRIFLFSEINENLLDLISASLRLKAVNHNTHRSASLGNRWKGTLGSLVLILPQMQHL